MTFAPDPTTEPVSRHHPSDSSPPPSLTAFTSVGASPEPEWEDHVPAAESLDDVAADSEDEAEWAAAAAAAAAELEDEAKWEDAAAAESEDDADTGEHDSPLPLLPSRAELFPRLEAACEARRLQDQEDRLLKRPPPPAGGGDPDDRPRKSRHWRRFRFTSSPATSALRLLLVNLV
jgi:hypothetical protein